MADERHKLSPGGAVQGTVLKLYTINDSLITKIYFVMLIKLKDYVSKIVIEN